MRPFRHTFTRAWPRRSMWLRATSPTKASSTRLALRCISRPARNTARTLQKMVASYSSSGLNDPRKRLPISATSSSPKKQLSENAHRPHLAGDFLADVRPEFSCRDFSCLVRNAAAPHSFILCAGQSTFGGSYVQSSKHRKDRRPPNSSDADPVSDRVLRRNVCL